MKTWNLNDPESFRDKPEIYEHLKGLPCIVIVVDKGRMGETFPYNFKVFDLRARYSTTISSSTTLEQDFGRACG